MSQDGFVTTLVNVNVFDSLILGRILGVINADFYCRADKEFYVKLLIGFDDRKLVNASYEWVEVLRPVVGEWPRSVRAGMGVYNGFELNHVLGTQIGGSYFDCEGVMQSAANLLSYAGRKRIELILFVSVERVLLARIELILSIVLSVLLDHLLIQVVGITESRTYLQAASYIVQFASPARPVFLRSPSFLTVATLIEKVVGPVSFGTLRLALTDVRAYPVVRLNYFSDAGHLERCINGTRIMGGVLNSLAMDGFKIHQWFGMRDFRFVALLLDQWDEALRGEFCRRTMTTIWHYHGGCLVGRVVDRDLKVIEVNDPWIVDGSAFTVSPGTNPQATVLMSGRSFGMKLLKERTRRTSSM